MASADTRADRRARLATARLYLVCDGTPGGRELAEVLPAAIRGGVDVVQLREKEPGDADLIARARIAKALCEEAGALFIVNDRPDIAIDAGADGVHVGQEDMPVAAVRELVGEGMLIGLSTHRPSEIDAAAGAVPSSAEPSSAVPGGAPAPPGAAEDPDAADSPSERPDYIGVGPIHGTPTKPGRQAVGLGLVRYAAKNATMPFFAIGGLDAGNVSEVLEAGAGRVCVLRAIAEADNPEAAARELRAQIDAAPTEAGRA
jgi:thiamine-phosphate pyrophosphorylase